DRGNVFVLLAQRARGALGPKRKGVFHLSPRQEAKRGENGHRKKGLHGLSGGEAYAYCRPIQRRIPALVFANAWFCLPGGGSSQLYRRAGPGARGRGVTARNRG